MRVVFLLLMLAACSDPAGVTAGVMVAEGASVAVFGRGIVDIGVSAVTGRDCSIVRLDRGQTYCAPRYLAPEEPAFCTRSLGVVDCWADPANLPPGARSVADTPAPTREQSDYRAARWPKSLTAGW